jgi:hypothetical protein
MKGKTYLFDLSRPHSPYLLDVIPLLLPTQLLRFDHDTFVNLPSLRSSFGFKMVPSWIFMDLCTFSLCLIGT